MIDQAGCSPTACLAVTTLFDSSSTQPFLAQPSSCMIPSSRFLIASAREARGPSWEAWTDGVEPLEPNEQRQLPEPRNFPRRGSAMAYWLFKSEPDVYGFDHLLAETDQTTGWDGVRNYQARNFLRDSIKVGDGVLFYHSNADPAVHRRHRRGCPRRPSRPHRVRSRVGAPRPQERSRQPHLVPGLDQRP